MSIERKTIVVVALGSGAEWKERFKLGVSELVEEHLWAVRGVVESFSFEQKDPEDNRAKDGAREGGFEASGRGEEGDQLR